MSDGWIWILASDVQEEDKIKMFGTVRQILKITNVPSAHSLLFQFTHKEGEEGDHCVISKNIMVKKSVSGGKLEGV